MQLFIFDEPTEVEKPNEKRAREAAEYRYHVRIMNAWYAKDTEFGWQSYTYREALRWLPGNCVSIGEAA